MLSLGVKMVLIEEAGTSVTTPGEPSQWLKCVDYLVMHCNNTLALHKCR